MALQVNLQTRLTGHVLRLIWHIFISLKRKYGSKLFDETYIIGIEDTDLSWRIKQDHIKAACIDYRIGDIIGGTRDPYNLIRKFRGLVNNCYLNFKIERGELEL